MSNLYRCENNNISQKIGEKTSPPIRPPLNPSKKKKLNFKSCKNNTINSLNEVEYFLRNIHGFMKYVKLYKLFK